MQYVRCKWEQKTQSKQNNEKTGFMIISIILLVQPAGYLSLGFIGFIYKSA